MSWCPVELLLLSFTPLFPLCVCGCICIVGAVVLTMDVSSCVVVVVLWIWFLGVFLVWFFGIAFFCLMLMLLGWELVLILEPYWLRDDAHMTPRFCALILQQ